MCTERDCSIFKGMITACDECERNAKASVQTPGIAEKAPSLNS